MHFTAIKRVVFDASFANVRPTKCYAWFQGCSQLTAIQGLEYLNTSEVDDMQYMFSGCSILTSLDLSGFDTHKVEYMDYMFLNCENLQTIFVSDKFVTTVVKSSSSMFTGCTSIKGAITYDRGKTDATYANYTDGYFTKEGTVATPKGAYAIYTAADNTLTFNYGEIPASVEGVSAVYNIPTVSTTPGWKNAHASAIKRVVFDASFANERPTKCYSWFYGCSALEEIEGIANLNTSDVNDMRYMFYGCSSLTSLDLSGFDTQKVKYMGDMFRNCKNLKTIFVSDKFVTTVVQSSSYMFSGCTSIEGGVAYSSENTNDVTYAKCTTGYFTDVSEKKNFVYHAVYNSSSYTLTFKYGNKTKLDTGETAYELNTGKTVPGWISYTDITKVVFDMSFAKALPTSCFQWFKGLSSLTTIEGIGYLNTSEVTDMNEMFSGCSSLSSLQLTTFNTAKVTDMNQMFYNCSSLKTIYTSNLFDVTGVTVSDEMFTGCKSLVGAITYDAVKVTKDYANSETGYFIQKPEGEGTSESPYLIRNASGLVWFRDHVNQGNRTACARLEADIDMSRVCHAANTSEGVAELSWMPISDNSIVGSKYWYGTFDGNNKTLSNLYINTSAKYSGLFGYIYNMNASERGTIKNIKFENVSLTSTADYLGVLAGYARNTDISGITVNSGTVNGTKYCGGIVGYIAGSSLSCCINKIDIIGGSSDGNIYIGGIVGFAESSSSITNCANYGNVKGYRSVGGIAGSAEETTIENVFSSGNVTCINTLSAYTGLVVGEIFQNVTISGNVIYNSEAKLSYGTTAQTTRAFGRISSYSTVKESDATGLTADQLKNGWGTWLLNGSSPNGGWGQQIGTEDYPVWGGAKVYSGYKDCLNITYSNNQEELSESPVHDYDNGICKACGAYQPATQSGKYEIGNAGQLYWFAGLVNGTLTDGTVQNLSANAVLVNDITVNTGVLNADGTLASDVSSFKAWTPIVGSSYPNYYAGTFDGQNHTVSGLYFNDSSVDNVGLFGAIGSSGKISNVGVVDSYFCGNNNIGGVCGAKYGTMENCYSASTVSGKNSVGGVCGNNYDGNLLNCYNTGAVIGTGWHIGGVCGIVNRGTIQNCYSTGTVGGSSDPSVGGVIGSNSGTITNCYYLIGTATGGINGADAAGSAEGKAEAQFANGEVCYLLNESKSAGAWGQTLSGTGKQDYPVLGGMPVYYRAEVYANTYGILTEGTQTITASSSPNVWYEFTPTETGTYRFSSTDIEGSICVNTEMTSNETQNMTTSPTYSLSAGITYYVYVNYISGEYKLTITKLSTTTALEAVTASPVYAVDGRIVCAGEFRIYDLLGRDVTRLNGSLCGVYVVKIGDAAVKVVVK